MILWFHSYYSLSDVTVDEPESRELIGWLRGARIEAGVVGRQRVCAGVWGPMSVHMLVSLEVWGGWHQGPALWGERDVCAVVVFIPCVAVSVSMPSPCFSLCLGYVLNFTTGWTWRRAAAASSSLGRDTRSSDMGLGLHNCIGVGLGQGRWSRSYITKWSKSDLFLIHHSHGQNIQVCIEHEKSYEFGLPFYIIEKLTTRGRKNIHIKPS